MFLATVLTHTKEDTVKNMMLFTALIAFFGWSQGVLNPFANIALKDLPNR